MLKLINQNRIYFIFLALYFSIGAATLLVLEKGEVELFINRRHHVVLDYFFQFSTYLGDGFFALSLILLLFFFSSIFRSLVMATAVIATFIVIQGLKIYIFPSMPRPSSYFPESANIYYVEGIDIHSFHSFPSGHSAQAFAIFLIVTLFSKNKNWGVLFFILAFSTTLSRMYLMQHFLLDTYFGALIATIIALATYFYFMNHTTLSEKERWQKGLFS